MMCAKWCLHRFGLLLKPFGSIARSPTTRISSFHRGIPSTTWMTCTRTFEPPNRLTNARYTWSLETPSCSLTRSTTIRIAVRLTNRICTTTALSYKSMSRMARYVTSHTFCCASVGWCPMFHLPSKAQTKAQSTQNMIYTLFTSLPTHLTSRICRPSWPRRRPSTKGKPMSNSAVGAM